MPGGDSNSEPTPKAFGAVLPVKIVNYDLWIFCFRIRSSLAASPSEGICFFATISNVSSSRLVIAVCPRRCCALCVKITMAEPM